MTHPSNGIKKWQWTDFLGTVMREIWKFGLSFGEILSQNLYRTWENSFSQNHLGLLSWNQICLVALVHVCLIKECKIIFLCCRIL
jgi:hypothetical protein